MPNRLKTASELHKDVPPDWYYKSVTTDKNFIRSWVHKKRFKEISKHVEEIGGKILDIGSADGMFTKVILDSSKAQKIVGIDVLRASVDWASNHWKNEKKLEFRVGDAHNLKFKQNEFDAIFALEVLEHVFEPQKVLRQMRKVLKKNGYVLMLVPAETLLFRVIWYFWTKYTASRIWKETHIHAYSGDYLVRLVREAGFKVEVDKKIIFGSLHLIKARKK